MVRSATVRFGSLRFGERRFGLVSFGMVRMMPSVERSGAFFSLILGTLRSK